jgi:hypothetical protein
LSVRNAWEHVSRSRDAAELIHDVRYRLDAAAMRAPVGRGRLPIIFVGIVADSLSHMDTCWWTIVGHQQLTDTYLAAPAGDVADGVIRFKAGVPRHDSMLLALSAPNQRPLCSKLVPLETAVHLPKLRTR